MSPASREQLTAIHTLFAQQGVVDRSDKLWLVSQRVGRPITTTAELTGSEAHDLIERLAVLQPGDLLRVLARRGTTS